MPAGVLQFATISSVAFAASMLSSMSGAGAGILTTPVWLSMGFPLPAVIASNQLNGAAWTPIAARNYLEGRDADWALIRAMMLISSPFRPQSPRLACPTASPSPHRNRSIISRLITRGVRR